MKTVEVEGWTSLLIRREGDGHSSDFFDHAKVKEGGLITVTPRAVQCSCDAALDSCAYLRNSGARFTFGAAGSAFDRALELAMTAMREGESILVRIGVAGKYVSAVRCSAERVTLSCELEYTVVEEGKELYELSAAEKLELASRYNEAAVRVLRESDALEDKYCAQLSAFLLVAKALKWLASEPLEDLEPEERSVRLALETRCYSNLSHFHLAFGNDERAAAAASLALERSPEDVKAAYRRAVANTNLQNYELAEVDLQAVLKSEPSNGAAKRQLKVLREKTKKLNDKYAEAMKKFLAL